MSACSGATEAPTAVVPGPDGGAAAGGGGEVAGDGGLVLVLPAADRLAPEERARVRMLVQRAVDEVVVAGPRPTVLEPASTAARDDTVEAAVRRSATVCVLGRDAEAALTAALKLYPSRTGCLLPRAPNGRPAGAALAADVDLEEVGRALGSAARLAAGDGGVLVLDAADGMLDARWTAGVLSGAVAARTPDAQQVVRSTTELLQVLDDQVSSSQAGGEAGGPAGGAGGGSFAADLDDEDGPLARVLPAARVVVLDGSGDAAEVVGELLERGLGVIAPRSLLVDRLDHPGVVLTWRVRWDVPLAVLLRQVLDGELPAAGRPTPTLPLADVLVLEPGPAAPRA